MSISGRLREAMVEAAAPGACRVHEEAVEHRPSRLVGVESLVEEVTQEAAGLRDAEAEPPAHGKRTRLVVLGVRHHVPHRGEADPDHDGVTSAVDQFVDLARLEAAGAGDPCVLLNEAPLLARHDPASGQPAVALGEYIGGVVGVRRGVDQ